MHGTTGFYTSQLEFKLQIHFRSCQLGEQGLESGTILALFRMLGIHLILEAVLCTALIVLLTVIQYLYLIFGWLFL